MSDKVSGADNYNCRSKIYKKITDKQKSVFNGLVLSDCGIEKPSKNARLRFTVKSPEFAHVIISNLSCFSWANLRESDDYDKRTSKKYHSCKGSTHVSTFLTEEYDKWYKNKIKIVPNDLQLDKDVLLWWYLGDGNLHLKKGRPKYRRVILATDSFSMAEKELLKHKLIEILGDNIYIEGKRTIVIAGKSLVQFAKLLGDVSPVSVYQYKFDFGQYKDENYFKKSYKDRPLIEINKYRKKHKVRELDYNLVKKEALI